MGPLESTDRSVVNSPSRLALGLVVLLLGMAYLDDRLDWMGFHLDVPVWPLVLVLLGLAGISRRRASGRPCLSPLSAWLLFLGAWGLVNEYRLFDISYRRTWPVLLVGAGLLLVVRSQQPAANAPSGDGR